MSTLVIPATEAITPHIQQVRKHLMDTLADLRNREAPMEVDRARAIAQVASVLVDTAKVEIDYLKITHQDRSDFLEAPAEVTTSSTLESGYEQGSVQRFPGVTRHMLKG